MCFFHPNIKRFLDSHLTKRKKNANNQHSLLFPVSTLPIDKILDVTKLKAFADDKFNIARMMIFLLDSLENTVGKEENAGYQHFLLYLQCFSKLSSSVLLKVRIVW